jgi:hypothetical protein
LDYKGRTSWRYTYLVVEEASKSVDQFLVEWVPLLLIDYLAG